VTLTSGNFFAALDGTVARDDMPNPTNARAASAAMEKGSKKRNWRMVGIRVAMRHCDGIHLTKYESKDYISVIYGVRGRRTAILQPFRF
jgi:hypothetical protein